MTNLSDQQDQVLELLLSGHNVEDAAQQLGVEPDVIDSWFQDPDFQEVLEDKRQKTSAEADRLITELDNGLRKLQQMMKTRTPKAAIKQKMNQLGSNEAERDAMQARLGILEELIRKTISTRR